MSNVMNKITYSELCDCANYAQRMVYDGVPAAKAIEIITERAECFEGITCITIKQPWASLIANGLKTVETRGWQTKYRGKLYIHAGQGVDKEALNNPIIKTALETCGINPNELPIGQIIAKADLKACVSVIKDYGHLDNPYALLENNIYKNGVIRGSEYHFGDYTVNRYAWILDNIQKLETPITAKGKLGLWKNKFSTTC